jgi:glycosyltransferase involved in cell wall biosynthesis
MHNPKRLWTLVTYLRSDWDAEFSIGDKARKMELNYEEIVEHGAFDLKTLKKIVRLIRDNKIDILHSRDYKANFYALIIRRFFCKELKIVTTAHGWVGNGFKLNLYYSIDKFLVASFDRNFILFKDQVKLFLRKPKKENTIVIHNGIDSDAWNPSNTSRGTLRKEIDIDENSIIVGFVGRIMPEKDIITMVKVAHELINNRKLDLHFVLVGESKSLTYEKKVKDAISTFNLEKRFLLMGKKTDLQKLYVDFSIFLMTSLQEGFPNSLLEAMAMKVPSVVTSIDGIPEIIKNKVSGILCRPKDVTGIANSVELVINDIPLRCSITNNARHIVETDLSFVQRLQKMEDAYEQLLL